jgi:hypothetical protein
MTRASDVPNFDAMEPDELMEFWSAHNAGRGRKALFPDGGLGTMRATADLANYASNKATAMRCRLKGDIETAQMYERICETIYNGLPEWARW